MEASLKEQNKRNDKEKKEKLEKERLQKEEEEAIQLKNDLERQAAIRKATEEAEAAVDLVNRGVEHNTQSGTDSIDSAGSMVPTLPLLEKKMGVVDGQDAVGRVEEELAVIVGASDSDDMRENVDARQEIIEHTDKQNVDRNRGEEEHSTLEDSVSDEALRELCDKQHGSSVDKEERNDYASNVTGIELSAIFGPGASAIEFNPVKSSTPTREDPNKRSASMGDV